MYMTEPAAEPAPIVVTPIKGATARATAPAMSPAKGARAPVLVGAGPAPVAVAPASVVIPTSATTQVTPGSRAATPWPIWVALVVSSVATVALGIWQYPWIESITQAVATLGTH